VGRQDLEGDGAVEIRLAGLVDGAHASLADQLQDLELRKAPGQSLGGGRVEAFRTVEGLRGALAGPLAGSGEPHSGHLVSSGMALSPHPEERDRVAKVTPQPSRAA
jgi:hypothetical protein